MEVTITLSSFAGVLDTRTIKIGDGDDSAEISNAIWSEIDDWILAPGDTISISEAA